MIERPAGRTAGHWVCVNALDHNKRKGVIKPEGKAISTV